jgi:hypothetical protein
MLSSSQFQQGVIVRFLAVVLFMSFLAGCTSVYKQDGVSSLPSSKMAVIDVPPCKLFSQCIFIQEIDGKWRGVGSITRYELLPGVRTLKLVFVAPGKRGEDGIIVRFDAQPGKRYAIEGNVSDSNMTWRPEVVNAVTREVVSRNVGVAAVY